MRFFGDALFWQETRLCLHDPHRDFFWKPAGVESLFTLPGGLVVSPVYARVGPFLQRQRHAGQAVFFVKRDPRDVVVSLYFSARYSHKPTAAIAQGRSVLAGLSETEGMQRMLQSHLPWVSDVVAEWSQAEAQTGGGIRCFKFEDLFGRLQRETFRSLLNHCALSVSDQVLDTLLQRHSFERLAGRDRGTEDVKSHFRKGVAGGWRDYFTEQDCLKADGGILRKLEIADYLE